MAENKDYNGSIKIYGSMVPAGSFPLVQAKDVFVDSQTRLDKKLESFGSANTPKFEVRNDNELWVSYDNGETWELLGRLPQGPQGLPGNVTIDNRELRFYVGETEEEFNNEVEDKTNVFAIIDDPEEGSLIGKIQGFVDGSIPVPTAWDAWHATTADSAESAVNSVDADGNIENIAKTYVRKDEKKVFTKKFTDETIMPGLWNKIAELPEGKSIDDIVGLSANVLYEYDDTTSIELRLFAVKTFSIDEAEPSKENGKSPEIKFYMTMLSKFDPTDVRTRYAYAEVSLFTYLDIYTGKDNVEICFDSLKFVQHIEGDFAEYPPDYVSINADINSYKFFLDRVTYWFA